MQTVPAVPSNRHRYGQAILQTLYKSLRSLIHILLESIAETLHIPETTLLADFLYIRCSLPEKLNGLIYLIIIDKLNQGIACHLSDFLIKCRMAHRQLGSHQVYIKLFIAQIIIYDFPTPQQKYLLLFRIRLLLGSNGADNGGILRLHH